MKIEVALLAEGVDRNIMPAVRRGSATVALLAEGVDRNRSSPKTLITRICRPPRGGRG